MTAFPTSRRRRDGGQRLGPVLVWACLLVAAWPLPTAFAGVTGVRSLPPSLLLGPGAVVERAQMPPVDTAALILEDAELAASGRAVRPRFAAAIPRSIRPESSGNWVSLADGSELWRLRISSSEAKNLNLGMTRFELPPGAVLWVHDADGAQVYGPYTFNDRNAAGGLWTPVIVGDELEVELLAPPDTREHIDLEIGFVNHGYRTFGEPSGASDHETGRLQHRRHLPGRRRLAATNPFGGSDQYSRSLLVHRRAGQQHRRGRPPLPAHRATLRRGCR